MMRSLFSGVSGLKTHQTKMDVIGNNIANVNTVAYKSMSITFTDLMYQTTQKATGPDGVSGKAGQNAKQIGLGSNSGAISTAITTAGATQTTGNPFDLRITGDSFFIVRNGNTGTYNFTRDGSFYIDANGNLAMASTGYNVLGWQVDSETMDIRQDTVSSLKIMSAENMTYEPEATSLAYVSGILDKNDTNVNSLNGKAMSLGFFDNLGYSYFAKVSVHTTTDEGTYYVVLDDVTDADGKSISEKYGTDIRNIVTIGTKGTKQTVSVNEPYASTLSTKDNVVVDTADILATVDKSKIDADELTKLQKAIDKYFDDPTQITSGSDEETLLQKYYGPLTGTLKTLHDAYGDMVKNGYMTMEVCTNSSNLAQLRVRSTLAEVQKDSKYLTVGQLQILYDVASGKTAAADKTALIALLNGAGVSTIAGAAGGAVADPTGTYYKMNADAITAIDGEITSSGLTDMAAFAKAKLQELYPNMESKVGFDNLVSAKIDTSGNFVVTSKIIEGAMLKYDTDTGAFISIQADGGAGKTIKLDFADAATNEKTNADQSLNNFMDIEVDFSPTTMWNNNGTSTVSMQRGDKEKGLGAGRKIGTMDGVSIQTDGKIYGTYTNGCTKLLGQIAVAQFANAAGLEKQGENLYQATLNSGDFDGIGMDISSDDGSMTSGTLEMSNVDLANEFTEMITTQRGYQANSRIITVSDTLLEELVNLKR